MTYSLPLDKPTGRELWFEHSDDFAMVRFGFDDKVLGVVNGQEAYDWFSNGSVSTVNDSNARKYEVS